MPQGLEIWDENGNQILSLTDRIAIVTGEVNTGGVSGSVTVSGLDESSSLFYTSIIYGADDLYFRQLRVSASGRTISWNYVQTNPNQTTNRNARIIYGAW